MKLAWRAKIMCSVDVALIKLIQQKHYQTLRRDDKFFQGQTVSLLSADIVPFFFFIFHYSNLRRLIF